MAIHLASAPSSKRETPLLSVSPQQVRTVPYRTITRLESDDGLRYRVGVGRILRVGMYATRPHIPVATQIRTDGIESGGKKN